MAGGNSSAGYYRSASCGRLLVRLDFTFWRASGSYYRVLIEALNLVARSGPACAARWGIQHIQTTAYHPQSNGLVERFHCQLKEALKASSCGAAWVEHLPWVLLGIRTALKDVAGVSATKAALGFLLALPSQPTQPPFRPEGEVWPTIPITTQRPWVDVAAAEPGPLRLAEFVYLRRPERGRVVGGTLTPVWSSPQKVLYRQARIFQLLLPSGPDWVSEDRLKPHTSAQPVTDV